MRVQRRRRRAIVVSATAAVVALVAVVVFAATMPARMASHAGEAIHAGPGPYASILSSSGSLGYVVVAILAFVLGACVTVLCFRLREKDGEKDDEPW